MKLDLKLTPGISLKIITQTQKHFGYKTFAEAVKHQNNEAYIDYQRPLQLEYNEYLATLRTKFPGATDGEIDDQLESESGPLYDYWLTVPAIVKERKCKDGFYNQLVDVADLSWIVKERSYVNAGLYLSGAAALYYCRHERIIGVVHGICAALLYTLKCGMIEIEDKCSLFKKLADSIKDDQEVTSGKVVEEAGRIFESMKNSGLFLRYFMKAHFLGGAKTEELLKTFSEFSRVLNKREIPIQGEFDATEVKAFFNDLGKCFGKEKRIHDTWMIGWVALSLYALRQRVYLAAALGACHVALAAICGRTLGTFQGVSLAIAVADNAKVVKVYQEQAEKCGFFKNTSERREIHAEVIRLEALQKIVPNWRTL